MKPFRIGMVQCDGHAYTFGPLMVPCDVEVYKRNFHTEYFWMIDGARPEKLRTPIIPGFRVVKLWDPDPEKAAGIRDLFFGKPEICEKLEDVAKGIDAAFINCCNGNGEQHLQYAAPFLKRGIPTYVDKPFTDNVKDAKTIVRLARKHKAPLFSASILTYTNETLSFKRRLRELVGPIRFGVVKGVTAPDVENLGAIIHGLGLALGVFGDGIESVECVGTAPLEHMLLHYAGGLDVMINNVPGAFEGFRCDAYSDQRHNPPYNGHLQSRSIYDHEFVEGALNILRAFRKMLRTGAPPHPYEFYVEKIATIEAARLAQKRGKRVYLKEVLKGRNAR